MSVRDFFSEVNYMFFFLFRHIFRLIYPNEPQKKINRLLAILTPPEVVFATRLQEKISESTFRCFIQTLAESHNIESLPNVDKHTVSSF